MTTIREMSANFHKLDKFEGVGFQQWQKKMHFLLSALNMAYVLSSPEPKESETETFEEQQKRNKWENDDYVCCGHILNETCLPKKSTYVSAKFGCFKKSRGHDFVALMNRYGCMTLLCQV